MRARGPVRRDARGLFLEPLEERRVLTCVPIVWPNMGGNDEIELSDSSGNLHIVVNGDLIYNEAVGDCSNVTVEAGSGTDTIDILSLPSGGGGGPAVVTEAESNDTTGTAQSLEGANWTTASDPNVNRDDAQLTTEPHLTVQGTIGLLGDVDVYKFQVTVPTGGFLLGYFDIDLVDQSKLDASLELLDENGVVIADNDDNPIPDLLAGSSAYNGFGDTYDPLLTFPFTNEGTHDYYIRVIESPAAGVALDPGASYSLQVVVPNHSLGGGGGTPLIIVNGGGDADTLTVAGGIMPLSAMDESVLTIGPLPFQGTLSHGAADTFQFNGVETFNGGAAYTVLTDLAYLGKQDGSPDSTFVRPDTGGTKMLVDVNGVTYFAGGIGNILIAAVNGSSDADTILVQNTSVAAHIDGGAGNDTITTSAAPDIVHGGEGDDTISSGDGDDTLFGNGGNDALSGQGGNDIVSGGAGDDQVAGQSGQDVLIGGTGLDQLLGNSDRDLLFASWVKLDGNDISEDFEPLQQLRIDWLKVVVTLEMSIADFRNKYTSGNDDGVEDKLQGGNGDDLYFSDGSARIIDSTGDRDPLT